jgi:hypothetical protein
VFPQNNIQFRDFRHQHNQIIVSQAHRWNPPPPSASRGPMKRKDCLIFQVNLQGAGLDLGPPRLLTDGAKRFPAGDFTL